MTLQARWNEFVDEIADQRAIFDKEGSELMRTGLKRDFPPTEESLIWAKAYTRLQHFGIAFAYTCINQNMFEDALLVKKFLEALNKTLLSSGMLTVNEFCKEVKFP